MKRLLLPLLLATLCAALPASADPGYSLFGETNWDIQPYDVLEPVWFLLSPESGKTYADYSEAWVDWEQGSTRVRVYLSLVEKSTINEGLSGLAWAAALPINHAGKAVFSFTVVDGDGTATTYGLDDDGNHTFQPYTIKENFSSENALGPQRYPDIYSWVGSGTALGTGWWGDYYVHTKDSSIDQKIRLMGTLDPTTKPVAEKGSTSAVQSQRGLLRSDQLAKGVGVIWFKARMALVNTNSTEGGILRIDRMTTSGQGRNKYWYPTNLAEVIVPPAEEQNQWQQFRVILQDAPKDENDLAHYLIYNNTWSQTSQNRTTNAIDICDIVLTPPIPEVRIVKDNVDYAPRFPSVLDPIEFRIGVEDVFHDAAPAQFITPRLVWRQGGDSGKWREMVMTNLNGKADQGPGTYAYTLTKADELADGPFEYFYEVSYTGYTPLFPVIKDYEDGGKLLNHITNDRYERDDYPYLIDMEALSFLTVVTNDQTSLSATPVGLASECRSPAVYPDFERQRARDFLYPFEPGDPVHEYDDYFLGPCVVPGTAATNSLWGFSHRFDPRKVVTTNGYESAYGGTLNLWHAPHAETWDMVLSADGTLAYAEPGEVQVEAEFKYLGFLASDGVRRFRSNFTDLAAATRDHEDALKPSLLDPSYPMQHVGDYTWQAIIHITNRIDSVFSVTGACPTAAGRAEDCPVAWLQVDQEDTDINPPMSGEMSVSIENGVAITNHSELVRFDTEPKERWRKEVVDYETKTTNGVEATFWAVGVVTNQYWYEVDGEGNRIHDPSGLTDNDVAYWYGRLGTEIVGEVEIEGVVTEVVGTSIVANVRMNAYPDGRGGWVVDRWNDFSDYINWAELGQALTVTNTAKTLYTNLVESTEKWSETTDVRYVVYEPVRPEEFEDSVLGTRVDIDYDGFLMFRFCTTNGSYQIRRAAWQDFNEWQADNDGYDQSFGLYDMKTWTSDLEGRETTAFSKSFETKTIEDAPTGTAWADDDGVLIAGLVMKNGMVVEDRGYPNWMANPTASTTARNKAILLDTFSDHRGSLTTTSSTGNREWEDGVIVGGGRDTLRMRVRSFSDDARTVTYKGANNAAGSWDNYRVVARVFPTASDVSPGEHSLSLVGYWQDNQNYWEARIIQKSEFTGDEKAPLRNWFEVHVYNWIRGKATEVFGKVHRYASWGWGDKYWGDGDQWNQNYAYISTPSRKATWPVWNNSGNTGSSNEKGYSGALADAGLFTSSYGGGWTFVFDLKTDGTSVKPVVRAWRNEDISKGNTDNGGYSYDCSADGNCGLAGTALYGRPGWNTRDCGLDIGLYLFDNSGETPETVSFSGSSLWAREYKAMSQGTPDTSWDFNEFLDSRQPDGLNVWKRTNGALDVDSTPVRLKRLPPEVYYNVQVYRTWEEDNTDTVAPVPAEVNGHTTSWDDEWDGYHHHASDGIRTCKTWGWTDVSFPMAFWDDAFVRVRARDEKNGEYSRAKLVVDGLECSSWRGKDVADPENRGDWRAYYAVIADDPTTQNGRRYELNRTRANPTEKAAQPQSIVSPLLKNGVGGILFNYAVSDYPVQIDVQMGVGSSWTSAPGFPRELAKTDPGEKPTLYVSFLKPGVSGRIRIVALDREDPDDPDYDAREAGELGTLYVDNIRVTDYPKSGDSSWEVYNALVSNFSQDLEHRSLKFDGLSDAASTKRSAVLNDATGKGADTVLDQVFDLHAPFIQTPSIETGVGEISFWYRASPDNGVGAPPAKIALLVAESASVPDEDWVELTPAHLNTNRTEVAPGVWEFENKNLEEERRAMAALTNIVTSEWTYFSAEFYKGEYRVLRIVSGDGETIPVGAHGSTPPNRVMIDNVLITEPVRSSIDVGTIEFLPGVPTTMRSTGARVTLVNPRLNPDIMHVYLDWYVVGDSLTDFEIETVDVNVRTNTTTEYAVITNFPTDGVNTRVSYPVSTIVTTVTTNVDPTVVSAALAEPSARPWGFDAWSRLPHGTIELTNSATPGEKYTYYTSEDIPTDTFEPDTVMQYAVRVEYFGKFAEPVNSATQGRAKNGFWFENPPWYQPIDLNVAFGTEEHPVAHVFVLSCTTNVVWINEFRPRLGVNNVNHQDEQFVELFGPLGAHLGGWRLEHWWNMVDNRVDPSWINYTNILSAGAAFTNAPNNATTNKGWGVYILGCSAIANRDEVLFPRSAETNSGKTVGEADHPFINNYGAMRLRRRMGAYVDRIAWGTTSQAKTMTDKGYEWAQYISSVTYESAAGKALLRDVNTAGDALAWKTPVSRAYVTIGGYNGDEENFLPDLEGPPEEKKVPLIDQPVILNFEFDGNDPSKVVLTFRVSVTNDVALESKDAAYTWTVTHRADLRDGYGTWNPFTRSQTEWLDEPNDVPANGTKDVQVRVPADPGASGRGVRFFRIEATPKN